MIALSGGAIIAEYGSGVWGRTLKADSQCRAASHFFIAISV
jgi:hypothetical protein